MDGLAAAQERTDQQLTRLATAQERTDGRMDQLTHRMDQLAESQQSMQRTFERFMVRTEEQFTSVRKEMREGYDQLGRRFDRLDEKHDALEKKHDRLDERHDRLETKMDASFADVRKQLGGLSLSVGMGLEAYALDKIPRLLEMHCGFKTESVFPETFTDGGKTEEIDVVVRGSIASQPDFRIPAPRAGPRVRAGCPIE